MAVQWNLPGARLTVVRVPTRFASGLDGHWEEDVSAASREHELLPLFPPPRNSPLDPPPLLLELQQARSVARVRLFDGGEAWLVTGFEDSRVLLKSDAFSADAGKPGYPRVHRAHSHFTSGQLNHMDPPEHDVYRRMLAPEFVVKRVNALAPTITASVVELLDAMKSEGPGVDLIEMLAVPVPALVTCAMLGVPYEKRDYFVACVDTFLGGKSSPEQVRTGRADLRGFLAELISLRADEPGDDLLSRVIVEQVVPGHLTAEQLVGFAELLLAAGFDTTHNTIGLGTLALLRNADQLELMRSDPSLVDGAVEEILRFLVAPHLGRHRVATRDIDIVGHSFKGGDGVIVALDAANRDPAVFPEPNRLDITRKGQPHLGFGYGVHQCLGAMFARVELRAVFSLLFERLPDLALAIPFEELRFKDDHAVYGCESLPVTW